MAKRDKEAVRQELETVMAEMQDGLYRFALWRVRNPEDARDIVQDVFVKFYFSRLKREGIINVKGYLYRSVGNACTDFLRTKHPHFEYRPGDDTRLDEEGNQCEVPPRYRQVERLLSEIPPQQSEVIRMRIMGGLSFLEIARILELPVTTATSRFKYGIDKIKSALNIKTQ